MWKAGWAAVRVAAPAYIVPFMFVYQPALLMIGDPLVILGALLTALGGTILLSASLFGYFRKPCAIWEQALLFAAAICLIKPGWERDLIGLLLAAVPLWVQRRVAV